MTPQVLKMVGPRRRRSVALLKRFLKIKRIFEILLANETKAFEETREAWLNYVELTRQTVE